MPTTTFLFADQVGSTEQIRALGDLEAGPLRATLMAGLIEATAEHGGTVIDLTGDGLFAAFTSSLDALAAASDMQSSVMLANSGRKESHRVAIRVGIHTGEPLINESGGYFGLAVVIARRLCDLASGDQILASEVVRSLAEPRKVHSFTDVGTSELKGVPGPVITYEVGWTPVIPSSPLLEPASDPGAVPEESSGIRQLNRVWNEVVAGSRRSAVVLGDQAQAVVEQLIADSDDGRAVLRAEAGTGEGPRGLLDVLVPYFRSCTAASLRMQLGIDTTWVCDRLPEIGTRLTTREPAEPARPPAALVCSILAVIGAERPVVMVVEDPEALPEQDLAALAQVADPAGEGAVLLVLVSRTSPSDTTRLAPVLRTGSLVINTSSARKSAGPATETPRADQSTTRYTGEHAPLAALVLPEGVRVALDPAGSVLGRGGDSDVRIDDTDVSRSHASIRAVGPNWVISDSDSLNGTEVNGEKVAQLVLCDGDQITIGRTKIIFSAG